MKKSISVILLISFILLTLIGCNNTETSTNTPDDTTDGDNSSTPAFVDPIKDYDTVDDSSAEGFVIKSKKYDYEDNNVVIMNVENQTDNNYTVTVDMTYYDDGGNEIDKESQSFEGFSANWQKYFVFEPNKSFDSYTYQIALEEYNSECYAQHVDVWFGELYERLTYRMDKHDDHTKYPTILARCYYKNSSSNNLMASYNFILIDNTGEIFVILKSGSLFEPEAKGDGYNNLHIAQFLEGNMIWPEELKGDVSAICAIENVTLYEK